MASAFPPAPPKKLDPAQAGVRALVDERRGKLARMLAFAGDLLAGLKRQHGRLWMAGLARTADQTAFVRAVDELAERIGQMRGMLDFLEKKPDGEALLVLTAVEPGEIATSIDAIEALAAKLPKAPTPPRPAGAVPPRAGPARSVPPAPAPSAPGGSMLGLLRRWTAPAEPEQRAAAPPADPDQQLRQAVIKARQAFDSAHKLVTEILAYVSPRLDLLKVALDATGLPGKRRPMELIKKTLRADAEKAGVPEPQLAFLPPLVRLFDEDMGAVRRVHPALVQWAEVKEQAGEARVLAGALRTASLQRADELLGTFDTGRYRAAVYPLTHLHLTFKGLPIVAQLFPVPPEPPKEPLE